MQFVINNFAFAKYILWNSSFHRKRYLNLQKRETFISPVVVGRNHIIRGNSIVTDVVVHCDKYIFSDSLLGFSMELNCRFISVADQEKTKN